ncbi:glycogen phosphorylase [Holotrichia oblita]|nr:glycogen phosphorylase [Holotrichia oblita]
MSLESVFSEALKEYGFDINDIYELESDPGLGNGGLGRLAACYLDSLATLDYPATGFTLRYEYGLFRQKIVDNTQAELPDFWLDSGDVWMMQRSEQIFYINMGGHVRENWNNGKLEIEYIDSTTFEAVPYDIMISGAINEGVALLRLWRATANAKFDMNSFSRGDYDTATRATAAAELITKVLYPTDSHIQGKQLRLSQQYFLVSASLQNIINNHINNFGTLDNFEKKAAIHINDTHPALAIPEMMRLLLDVYGYSWDDAWKKTVASMAYTNHTVLSEALETWDIELVKGLLPRIYMIIEEINRRFTKTLEETGNQSMLPNTSILWHNRVKMANLCIIGCHSINGVSKLHSEIIKDSIFKDFYCLYPKRFTNVTNGIAHRRWLNGANPRLSGFITELIGNNFYVDASNLSKLTNYVGNNGVLDALAKIKQENKNDFASYMQKNSDVIINPNSRFDLQVKRIHEYKRQLLNVLKIIHLYLGICDSPNLNFTPQTFIFGGKTAESYYHAKRIINLINNLSDEIKDDKRTRDKLAVVFLENYNVTLAERIIPAAEISEQISLAGKEASGTSNMKFMLNGALTLGTVDGANVEILEKVGAENMFTFGIRSEDVAVEWSRGYSASSLYSSDKYIKRIIDKLRDGIGGTSFSDIATYLTVGIGGVADPYMCLRDFKDYLRAHNYADQTYKDARKWNDMSLINIAKAGFFSADRSIEEYAKSIWNLEKYHK